MSNKDIVARAMKDCSGEPGLFIESNDLVLAHSQVHGWGPSPLIVVDIFRLEDGRIAEHWDVVQSEVPASKTASGNPMTSFNYSVPANENKLTGKMFHADLGAFRSELYFESEDNLIFKIAEGGGPAVSGHSEKVKITVSEVRPQVYMIAWKEKTPSATTN